MSNASAWSVTMVPNQTMTMQLTTGVVYGGEGSAGIPLWMVSIPIPTASTVISLLLSAPKAFVIDSITSSTATGTMTACTLASTSGGSQTFSATNSVQTATSTLVVGIGDAFTLTLGTGSATGLAIQIQGHYS